MSAHDVQRSEFAAAVVDSLYRLFKAVSSYEPEHPVSTRAVEDLLLQIHEVGPRLTLQFVGDVVFCDYEMVPLNPTRFEQVRQLTASMHSMGFKEIAIDDGVEAWELLELSSALAEGAQGRGRSVDSVLLEHVRWRDLPEIRWGEEGEAADLETFSAAQIHLALIEAESVSRDPEQPWPWAEGQNIVRRLENAVRRSPAHACFVAETAEFGWTPDRRAVCAALHTLRVLDGLGVNPQVTRATVHAAFALGIQGFEANSGQPLDEAATQVLPRLLRLGGHARKGLDPHRLRVCALLHSLVEAGDYRTRWFGPHHLLHLTYEIERGRWPDTLDTPLSLVDLLADAVLTRGERFSPHLVQVLVAVTGALPPGTTVQLEDGRVGRVLGPAEDPWRPRVQIGTAVAVPSGPVKPISGAYTDY